jgi:hypothetical protein
MDTGAIIIFIIGDDGWLFGIRVPFFSSLGKARKCNKDICYVQTSLNEIGAFSYVHRPFLLESTTSYKA